jgi:hypothetical protein
LIIVVEQEVVLVGLVVVVLVALVVFVQLQFQFEVEFLVLQFHQAPLQEEVCFLLVVHEPLLQFPQHVLLEFEELRILALVQFVVAVVVLVLVEIVVVVQQLSALLEFAAVSKIVFKNRIKN